MSFHGGITREEASMERSWLNQSALVIITAILVVVPGAWGQSTYETLYEFSGGANENFPSGVIFDQAGNLYGTTGQGGANSCPGGLGCGTVFKLTPDAHESWTESVLYNFCSLPNCADGFLPPSGLIFDQAGNLYGETYLGGGRVGCDCGVVFELSPNSDGNWTEKVLHHFRDAADGGLPIGGLIFDQAGNLYGTTYGGTRNGVVFRLTPNSDGSWTEKVLHSFPLNRAEGAGPEGGVIFDKAGNLYGTTAFGGNTSCGDGAGCGVVFELTPNGDGGWTEKVLHRFTDGADGGFPAAGLIFDQAGNLYGTTEEGGNLSQCVGVGCGGVFELIPNADGRWAEKVLHHFSGGGDGGVPFAAVILDEEGALYGTTGWGGNLNDCTGSGLPGGCGVVFKLTPNSNGAWNETVLHRFLDNPGALPEAGVIFDASGNLYGTTTGDGTNTFGSVFEITP
jgi:hypothetical protein